MQIRELRAVIAEMSDEAEVIVRTDSNARDHEVVGARTAKLESRYFGGTKPESAEPTCLVLDVL